MARQKHGKQSLYKALASVLRRARTSLYQPFADAPLPAIALAHPAPAQVAAPGPRTAKIIPFPSARPSARKTPAAAGPRILSPFTA